MRIRSTKPEFWRSKTIAALPWDVRLVLKGLESYVDDNGVGKDDIALIAADVFPRDLSASPPETLARLSEAISDLSRAGLIVRYEVNGENLIYIDRWKQLQRIDKPARGRFPRPDGTFEYGEDVSRESFRNPREDVASPPEKVAPGTGEQGNRGTEEQTPSSADADGFDEWWNHYPRKVGKAAARRKYEIARRKASADDLLAGLVAQLPRMQASDPKFIPHPETWLHQGRWEDEVDTADAQAEEGGWFQPFTLPACPPEIADDPVRYEEWVDEQRQAWQQAGGDR